MMYSSFKRELPNESERAGIDHTRIVSEAASKTFCTRQHLLSNNENIVLTLNQISFRTFCSEVRIKDSLTPSEMGSEQDYKWTNTADQSYRGAPAA